MNDFDETLPGPWEWDVKRLCASLHIVGRQRGWSPSVCDAVVVAAARSYRERICDYATWHTLDLFYERTEIRNVIEHFPTQHRSGLKRDMKRARRKDHLRAVTRFTEVVNGQRRFVDDPPLTVRLEHTNHDMNEAMEVIESYRGTLTRERRYMFDRFQLLDVAHRVVGVGSVGTRCWIGLLAARTTPEADFIVLQVKEAQPSVLEPYVGESLLGHHGKRVVVGQRLIQAASDVFLGWTEGPATGRSYYVRQLWDFKGQGDPMVMSRETPEPLRLPLRVDSRSLACSHRRCGQDLGVPREGVGLRPRDRGVRRPIRDHERSGLCHVRERGRARAGRDQLTTSAITNRQAAASGKGDGQPQPRGRDGVRSAARRRRSSARPEPASKTGRPRSPQARS